MRVWVVELTPRGTLTWDIWGGILGVFDTFEKAKQRAVYEINEDVRCNDFFVDEEAFDNFENHNKEHEDIKIEVFADKVENYNSYYVIGIIPKVIE